MTARWMTACRSSSKQRDELLLGADVATDAVVHVIEVSDDGALFGKGWEGEIGATQLRIVNVFAPDGFL